MHCDVCKMFVRFLARRCSASAVRLNRVLNCHNSRLTFITVNRSNVLSVPRCSLASSSGSCRHYFRAILEKSVPNSATSFDVVRVTNSGSRNGNVYMSLYQPFVFCVYSANSQIFA